jgi:hypothetical protein
MPTRLRNLLLALALAIVVVQPLYAALSDNLAVFWSLESDGSDDVGSSDLTAQGSPSHAAGKVGNGVDLVSASSQYYTRADFIDWTGDYTIALWAKFDSTAGIRALFGTDNSIGTVLLYYNNGSGEDDLILRSSFFDTVAYTGGISTGTWYHIVAWRDDTNDQSGIAINAGTPDTASATAGDLDANDAIQIGATNTGSFFDGIIDEVGVWTRVLTSQERTDLYNGGSGLAYPFSGGGGPTCSGGLLLRGVGGC